jgi:hypothetical protein
MARLWWMLAIPAVASAAPMQMTWQARVLGADGNPVNGTLPVTVTLWADAARTPPALWTDTFSSVPVQDGFFALTLGSGVPLDGGDLPDGGAWIDVAVGANPVIGPTPLRAAPYANRARSVSLDGTGTCNADNAGVFRLVGASHDVQMCDGFGTWRVLGMVDVGTESNPGITCDDIRTKRPSAVDGTYWIDPDQGGSVPPFQVWCEMETDGGWTLWANLVKDPTVLTGTINLSSTGYMDTTRYTALRAAASMYKARGSSTGTSYYLAKSEAAAGNCNNLTSPVPTVVDSNYTTVYGHREATGCTLSGGDYAWLSVMSGPARLEVGATPGNTLWHNDSPTGGFTNRSTNEAKVEMYLR